MESITISQKILNEDNIKELIEYSKSIGIKEAIRLSYYNGLKLLDILEIIDIPRRTIQGQLYRLGERILGYRVNFEQVRQSCMIRLINMGYTPEYITKFMGYSRKDTLQYRRRLAGYVRPKLRHKILIRDKCRCKICGETKRLHIDHILPVSKGGKTIESNLQVLCEECNIGKGNK